jgi:hypothetical protein
MGNSYVGIDLNDREKTVDPGRTKDVRLYL